jgi:hypothetical protein
MRTLRKSILLSAMAAALPFYMSDETAAGAPGEDPNAGASAAGASQESGTTQSATTATNDADTGGTASQVTRETSGPVPMHLLARRHRLLPRTVTRPCFPKFRGRTPRRRSPVIPRRSPPMPTALRSFRFAAAGDTVNVPVDSHAEAKDRFAGLLAKLHQFEEEVADELREDLIAIGTLLHLHSKASTNAGATGDYKAGDLSLVQMPNCSTAARHVQ